MKTLSGKIAPWSARQVEDRRHQTLPTCWLKARSSGGDFDDGLFTTLSKIDRLRLDPGGDGALLVALTERPPEICLRAMQAAVDRGDRVYLLADRTLDASALGLEGLGHVLARRVDGLPFSSILTDRGRRGQLLLTPRTSQEARWSLRLTPEQGQALFRASLHLFWHHALDEGWLTEQGLRFQAPLAAPFSVFLPPVDAPIRLDEGLSSEPLRSGATWYSPEGDLPATGAPSRIIVPPSGQNHQALTRLAGAGSAVTWLDLDMPAFSADQGQGELRLASSRWSLGLRLDAGQAQDFDVLSRWATAHREWRFVTEVSVGQLDDLVWLPDTDRPHEPSDEQIVSCGRVEAPTLSSVPLTEARSRPAPQPLAKRVIWTWTVDPPRVPQGADHDPLIHQWNELDSEFDRRLRTAHEGLDQIEAKRTSLLKRFSRLASEMLGFSRSREDLSHQASMINSVPISSVGPIQAIERVQKLYELEERVEAVREELGKTEQEAIIKEAREEQEHQWAAEQAKAQVRIAKIAEEKSTIETKIEEVHDAFGELNTIADRKDRRARSKRLKSDQERLEKRLGELESEEKRHRELLESPFEFRHPRPSPSKGAPKKGRKGRFVPEVTSRPELRIPAEALPAVGTLRVRQESRFLIINGWDDLEGGEAEAKRLGARLVAPAEGS